MSYRPTPTSPHDAREEDNQRRREAPPPRFSIEKGSALSSLLARGEEEIHHRRHLTGFAWRLLQDIGLRGGGGGEIVAETGRDAPTALGGNRSETCFCCGFAGGALRLSLR
jgi:hypothetical protein